MTTVEPQLEPQPEPQVTVYWRPGCPYCALLRRGLRRAGLPTREVNIWIDPDAAAAVRAATGGDETVPTVVIAGASMVNPSASQVLAAAARAGVPVAPRPEGMLRRLLGRNERIQRS